MPKKKTYDHRVPGKAPQLRAEGSAPDTAKENFVWSRKGFALRGVSGLQEGDPGKGHFVWQKKGDQAELKLS